jgi:hypothetical protein
MQTQAAVQRQFLDRDWLWLLGRLVCFVTILTGNPYRDNLLHVQPNLLETVPLSVRTRVWCIHDGSPAHLSRYVRDVLITPLMADGQVGDPLYNLHARQIWILWTPTRGDTSQPLCMKLLLTLHRCTLYACQTIHNYPASFNGRGDPWLEVSRRKFEIHVGFLSTCNKCNLLATILKFNFSANLLILIFPLFWYV